MKKYISVAVILSLIPVLGFSEHPRVTELIAQKQEKMEQLKKCKGTTKSLKIAGISTLGITAVGIGANIAEAVILNDKRDDLKEADTKLKQTQTKVDEKRKKDAEEAERLAKEKEKAEQEELEAKRKAEDEKAQKQAEEAAKNNFSLVCDKLGHTFLLNYKACVIYENPAAESTVEEITKLLGAAKLYSFKDFNCDKDIVFNSTGHSDIKCGEYLIRYAHQKLKCPKDLTFSETLHKCVTNADNVKQQKEDKKINDAFKKACTKPWTIDFYPGYLGCVNGDQNKDISQDELKKALTDIKIDGCKDEIVYTSAHNAYRECAGANKIIYMYKNITCGEDKEFKHGECQEKPVDISKLDARAYNANGTCTVFGGTKSSDVKYCKGLNKGEWTAKYNKKQYRGTSVCSSGKAVHLLDSSKHDKIYCVCKATDFELKKNLDWNEYSKTQCQQQCAAECASNILANKIQAN